MRKILTLFLSLMVCAASAYDITGKVYIETSGEDEPLAGAIIAWSEGGNGAVSGAGGEYKIFRATGAKTLTASFIGYETAKVIVDGKQEVNFILKPSSIKVDQVEIKSRRSNTISALSIEKRENITFAGLCKMACCNIAESFENSASVTVGYSDAVSGARQIKLLGYGGNYTQMLDEARPIMRGLGATYSLEYTPGMWLSGIQISKGVTSVVNGYEALTGQINLEHRKPTDPDRLFVNLFMGDDLRSEANITSAFQINNKLSTVILTHLSFDQKKMDHNSDGFLDSPLKAQYNFANRWLYQADNGVQLRYGVKFLYENRLGGEMDFDHDSFDPSASILSAPKNSLNGYGSEIENRMVNGYFKAGFPLKKNPLAVDDPLYEAQTTSNIAIIADFVNYKQNSYFGIKRYDGSQNSAYTNLLFQVDYGTKHKLISGASFTADLYKESLLDRYTTSINSSGDYDVESKSYNFDRDEITTGAFAEYTFKHRDKFDAVVGARGDYNNLYGWMFTPRAHLKWLPWEKTTLRASAGVGYRSMSLISDNMGMLATGRTLRFDPSLDPLEKGITAGASITQQFTFLGDERSSISVEYFRSQFNNQVIVDQEIDNSSIYFYNLDGTSFTNSYQVDFSVEPINRFTLYATYRYNDTKVEKATTGLVQTPLVDKFKGVLNLQYATLYDKWTFDFTAQINGQSRLPIQNGGSVAQSSYSPVYPMFFGQVTKKFRNIDIYVGCENIGNYRQKNPIISSGDPFSNSFNSTVVWGPIMGRKFYAGLRYTLKKY